MSGSRLVSHRPLSSELTRPVVLACWNVTLCVERDCLKF